MHTVLVKPRAPTVARFQFKSVGSAQSIKARASWKATGGRRTLSVVSVLKGEEGWHEVANEAAREEIVNLCMDAIAEGDEGALRECLVEAEAELEAEAQMNAKDNRKDMHQYLEQHKVDFSSKQN